MAQTLFTNGVPTAGLTASALDWTALDPEYNTPMVLGALLTAIAETQSFGARPPASVMATREFRQFGNMYRFTPTAFFTPASGSASSWGGGTTTSGTSNSANTLKVTDATVFSLASTTTSGTTNTAGTLTLTDASVFYVGASVSYLGAAYTITAITSNVITLIGASTITANSQSNGTSVYLMGATVLIGGSNTAISGKSFRVTAIDPTATPDVITLAGPAITANTQTDGLTVIASKRGVLAVILKGTTTLKRVVIGVPPTGKAIALTALPAIVDV